MEMAKKGETASSVIISSDCWPCNVACQCRPYRMVVCQAVNTDTMHSAVGLGGASDRMSCS